MPKSTFLCQAIAWITFTWWSQCYIKISFEKRRHHWIILSPANLDTKWRTHADYLFCMKSNSHPDHSMKFFRSIKCDTHTYREKMKSSKQSLEHKEDLQMGISANPINLFVHQGRWETQYIAMFNLLKYTLSLIEFCFVERLKLEIYAPKSIKGEIYASKSINCMH